jgi:hypothetical protein
MSDYRRLYGQDLTPVDDKYFEDLDHLAMIMSSRLRFPDDLSVTDAVANAFRSLFGRAKKLIGLKERKRAAKIPAGYTYFGQFLIHDISHLIHTDRHVPQNLPWNDDRDWEKADNLCEPEFNLEGVYGKEPSIKSEFVDQETALPFLKVGWTLPTAPPQYVDSQSFPCDLLRKPNSVEADIADKRNDENLVLAQTLLAFIKFHNVLVLELSKKPGYLDSAGNFDKDKIFKKARELNIRYYQTIILDDFLPRIIDDETWAWLKTKLTNNPMVRRFGSDRFIPLEFAIGAFRFGHSMIRELYDLNVIHETSKPGTATQPAKISDLQMFTGVGAMNTNTDAKKLPSEWIIDWNKFYELGDRRPNVAEPINTVLAKDLLQLRPVLVKYTEGRASSVAALDLYRSQRSQISSGQEVAKQLEVESVSAYWIRLIIKIKRMFRDDVTDERRKEIKRELAKQFENKTPLWFYVLAEAESGRNGRLGSVGGRIVAETIYQLIYDSEHSVLLHPEWEPDDKFCFENNKFDMPTLLRHIQRVRNDPNMGAYPPCKKFDELNPLGLKRLL